MVSSLQRLVEAGAPYECFVHWLRRPATTQSRLRRLEAEGHDVRTLDQETELERMDDEEVLSAAAADGRTWTSSPRCRPARSSVATGRVTWFFVEILFSVQAGRNRGC